MRTPVVPPQLTVSPFTLAQAEAVGLTRSALRSRAWRRIWRDVYVHVDVPDSLDMRIAAAQLVLPPEGVFSGTTAAWLHGVDIFQGVPEITLPRKRNLATRGGTLNVRQARLVDDDVTIIGSLPVTTPVRTAFDVARLRDPATAVGVLDALWRADLTTPDALASYASDARHRGSRGIRSVPFVVRNADRRAENPGESKLRTALVVAGLPAPTPQVEVHDAYGRFVARLDLAYERIKLAIELDGAMHDRADVRLYDLRRQNQLVALGWTVLRFSGADLRLPATVARTVERELRRLAA